MEEILPVFFSLVFFIFSFSLPLSLYILFDLYSKSKLFTFKIFWNRTCIWKPMRSQSYNCNFVLIVHWFKNTKPWNITHILKYGFQPFLHLPFQEKSPKIYILCMMFYRFLPYVFLAVPNVGYSSYFFTFMNKAALNITLHESKWTSLLSFLWRYSISGVSSSNDRNMFICGFFFLVCS